MRRFSNILRNLQKHEVHPKNKQDYEYTLFKKRRKLFINFQKKAIKLLQNKYSNPYIYKSISKEDLMTIKKESIPTLFGYYKILKLCNNIPCHYTSIFKDITIFSNTLTEYIPFFFSSPESHLFIKYSIYNVCYFLTNNFPTGIQIINILSKYRNKINFINKKNLNKALGINDIKKEPLINLNDFNDDNLENFLYSLYKEQNNNSKLKDNENKKQVNKIRNLNDSISSIEHLIQNINEIEEKKKKNEEKKKKLIIIKDDRRKSIIDEFKKGQITKKFVKLKTFKYSKRSLKVNLDTNRNANEEEEEDSEEQNINKFKSTFDFITNIREKKKYEKSKTQIIKDCIGLMKNKKKKNPIINYPNKIMEGHYKIFSETIIGLNDVFENERQLFLVNKTTNLLNKVKKRKEQDDRKLKKKWDINSLINYPNIYYNENYNNKTNMTIQPKSKYRLNKKIGKKMF